MPGPLQESLDHLRAGQRLAELPFQSRVPLLGPVISWFRRQWNNVSTTWYVRPLIDQQNRFNAAVVDHLTAQDARIDRQEAEFGPVRSSLHDHVTLLRDATTRLNESRAQIDDLLGRLSDHDAWLIEADREQSGYVRDLADVTLQLVQLKLQIQELSRRSPVGQAAPSGKAPPAEHSE